MLFQDIDKPSPKEIKDWMSKNDLNIKSASDLLGISQRQIFRFISGETKAKRIHALAMEMIWLLYENKKNIIKSNSGTKGKKIKIEIE